MAKAKAKLDNAIYNPEAVTQPPEGVATSSFLPPELRTEMLAKLTGWGIEGDKLTDSELVTKVSEYAQTAHVKAEDRHSNALTEQLNSYASGTDLADKEFIQKLFFLNVHKRYLRLFRDQDSKFTPERIWEIIRKSGINPVPNVQELYRDRTK